MNTRLFSGIQPTGVLHIGNYFGAIQNWVKLQNIYPSIFCLVDYHAITIPYQPKEMQKKIMDLAIDLLACGINPQKSIIFIQSTISEHTELTWLLGTIANLGDLQRMTQFKDKSKEHSENINAGLLNYPILMAADILLYKARLVPVGEDQQQHLELTRELARKFNKTFGKTFPEPKAILSSGARIMSLNNPEKKMSKSHNSDSYIAISDPPQIIIKKLSVAVTDPARKKRTDPGNPQKCNLYSLHQVVSNKKTLDYVANGCVKATIGCLDCKKILADNLIKELKPVQQRRRALAKNQEKIKKLLKEGTRKARKIARQTINEVKRKMGLI